MTPYEEQIDYKREEKGYNGGNLIIKVPQSSTIIIVVHYQKDQDLIGNFCSSTLSKIISRLSFKTGLVQQLFKPKA